MLLWLAEFFKQDIGFFRVFGFITFRAVLVKPCVLMAHKPI